MSLYLDEILKTVLNESVSPDEISDAIINHKYVDVNYVDEDSNAPGKRLVQAYVYGTLISGNKGVRVYQISGDSLRKREWKTMRLDRIISWNPRKQTFSKPAKGFDPNNDKKFSQIITIAKFDYNAEDTLAAARAATKDVQSAPKIANVSRMNDTQVNANQQWKRNVFTSQPNSKKYAQYAKNIKDTQAETDRFSNDIWAKAEKERQQQDKIDRQIKNNAKRPEDLTNNRKDDDDDIETYLNRDNGNKF